MNRIVKATLADICIKEKGAIISGPFGSNISKKFFVDEGVPVIRGNNLSLTADKFYDDGFVFITEEKAEELKCDAVRNDMIFTAAGTIGQVGIIPEDSKFERYVISNKQIRARIDTQKVDLLYAYYWFSSPWIQKILTNNNKGSTVPLLSLMEVKSLPIEYPEDISEQKKIANIIDSISTRIENNKKITNELNGIARTIYDYWFLQFDYPDLNNKPYKSSGGKLVWNEELKRKIPEGWTVKTVKDCIEHINTGLNPRDNFVLGNGNTRYITVKNLTTDGSIDFSDCDFIDDNARDIVHNRSDVSKGDILFASIAPLGRCAIVHENPVDWDINESVFCIRPNKQVSTEYLYMFFMSDYFIKKAEHSSTGSVFSGIRVSTLEDIKLIVPPDNVKKHFKSIVENLFYRVYICEKENVELSSLREFLLPMLMNGQIQFRK